MQSDPGPFTTRTLPRHEVLFRDWRDQVDADTLDNAIQLVFDGHTAPRLYDADTEQDAYAIVVSSAAMTPTQVQAAWAAYVAGDADAVRGYRQCEDGNYDPGRS